MPEYTIKTKDGLTVTGIPDNVDPDSPELRALVERMRQSKQQTSPYSGAMLTEPAPNVTEINPRSTVASTDETTLAGLAGSAVRGGGPYAMGAGLGAALGAPAGGVGAVPGAGLGVGYVALAKTVGDPVTSLLNKMLDTQMQTPSESFEALFDKMGIAKPKSGTERVLQAATEASAGGIGQVGLGRAMQATGMGRRATDIGRVLAADPFKQAASGFLGGVSAQGAQEMGAGPMGQLGAGILGSLAGGALAPGESPIASPTQGAFEAPSLQAERSAMGEAAKAKIPVMTSDVMPPQTFASKWIQSVGEKIPFAGTGGPRRVQQAARVEAIRDLAREYNVGAVANASDEVARDLLAKRSSDITKYTGMKSGVIEKLAPTGVVDVAKTVESIDRQIAGLNSLNTKAADTTISVLQDWKNAIQNQDLRNIEKLRAQVGESFKDPSLAGSRTLGEKALSSIYGPLKEDMGAFIKANGDRTDYTKWRVANGKLAESMQELNKDVLKNVLDKGKETPEVVQRMLFSSKPSDVKALVSGLSADGKAKAKIAILSKALEDAGGIEDLSPEKFITSVRKLSTPIGVAFDGQDAQRLNGLVKALKLTEHASKAALVPPTGTQAVPFLVADTLSAALGGPTGATVGAAGIGGLARVYESAPVRNLLMRIQAVKAGSPEEADLFNRFTAAVNAQKATRKEKEQ